MKYKFEFLAAPKFEIPNSDYKLALFIYPRDSYSALNFCQLYSTNGGTLYDITPEYKSVVQFAKMYGVDTFYISLNDNATEGTFVNSEGAVLSNDYDHLWMIGEPDNYIPDEKQFCEGNLNIF